MPSDLLTTNEVAERLGVDGSLVRRLCREGRLGTKIGSQWIITEADVEQYRADGPRKRGPKPTNAITGRDLCRLMRLYSVTIREMKKRTGITLKRIREVRETGLVGVELVRDWVEHIISRDPGVDVLRVVANLLPEKGDE